MNAREEEVANNANERSLSSEYHNTYEEHGQEAYYYGRNDCKLNRCNTFGSDSIDDEQQSATTPPTLTSSNVRAYPLSSLHRSESMNAVESSHIVYDSNSGRLTPDNSMNDGTSQVVVRRRHLPSGQYSCVPPPFIDTSKRSQSSQSLPSKFERDEDAAERKASRILNLSCLYCSFRRKHPRVPSLCSPTKDQENPLEVQAADTNIEFYKAFESDGGENDFISESSITAATSLNPTK
jgi:hypothetical protein